MASIARDKNGYRRILFVTPDGKRPTIRLGKISQRDAESIARHVEALLVAKTANQPIPQPTAVWLSDLPQTLAAKLARVGLIANPDEKGTLTLGKHLASYFEKRTDVKPSTLTHWNHTKRLLLKFFGENRPLPSITAGDAKDFERWLQTAEARE
ncbi:MAG: hypothetical protein IT427_09810, partial [Pirellulales bacterium]|nr:hypothetical protein [Pirellulales bacterium]